MKKQSINQILIVDDDPDDRLLLERAIRRAGIGLPILACADGEEAVNHFRAELEPAESTGDRPVQHEFVILDSNLPRRSGMSVLQWIRTRPELQAVLVLKMTARANPNEEVESMEAGANWCLAKTSSFREVAELVRKVAEGEEADDEAKV